MTTRAHYHPRDIDINTGNHTSLPGRLFDEIASWRGQISREDPPVFTCLYNGTPMYVVRNKSGRHFLRHFRRDNPDSHSHFINTMSDEHRRQCEYTQRAATNHGLAAKLEKSTGNHTRLDVAVYGDTNAGFEIQRSGLSRAHAKRRTKLSFDAGWPTAWITDREKDPDWADHVPTGRLTVRGWDTMPAPDTVNVIIGDFTRERDHTQKTGWRYIRQPRQVLLDDLAYLMPAGEIVPVAIGEEGRVSLAFAGAREIIDSCTYQGASQWAPDAHTPRHKEAPQSISRDCKHPTVELETCCWLDRGVFCACWRCLNAAIDDVKPNEFDKGCDRAEGVA